MPAGDRTGPWGMGPRTGRGMGYCSGTAQPGYRTAGPGLGFGRGYGRGFGRGFGLGRGFGRGRGMGRFLPFMALWAGSPWGYPYPAPAPYGAVAPGAYPPSVNEEEILADEAAALEAELDRVRQRLGELMKSREVKEAKDHEK
ncbi:MAG: DUF5320 domain-containing protein [Candidatus Aminicenantes bacterium]